MRSSTGNAFPASWRRDPVRAAEADIRGYLIRHGGLKASRPGNGRTLVCFLGLYALIALATGIGLFCLARLECDPLFSDRGLTTACRNHPAGLAWIVAPASNGYASFLPNMPQ